MKLISYILGIFLLGCIFVTAYTLPSLINPYEKFTTFEPALKGDTHIVSLDCNITYKATKPISKLFTIYTITLGEPATIEFDKTAILTTAPIDLVITPIKFELDTVYDCEWTEEGIEENDYTAKISILPQKTQTIKCFKGKVKVICDSKECINSDIFYPTESGVINQYRDCIIDYHSQSIDTGISELG